MNEPEKVSEETKTLIDDYLDTVLDEAGLRVLENELLSNPAAQHYFIDYGQLHTDMHFQARARQAGQRVLRLIHGDQTDGPSTAPLMAPRGDAMHSGRFGALRGYLVPMAIAASLATLVTGLWWRVNREVPQAAPSVEQGAIAWLVNAQDCQWAGDVEPSGDLRPGRRLRIDRGLAVISFESGSRVVLEGPAALELLTSNSARLLHGRLTARVPEAAKGFSLLAPQGQIIDLGTEFGAAVNEDGTTDVLVFEGEIEAQPAAGSGSVALQKDQAALLRKGSVVVQPDAAASKARTFARDIVPKPAIVPRTWTLDFRQQVAGSLKDAAGLGTGLTHRLPGTGSRFRGNDPNLRLDTQHAKLVLGTTDSNLNGQHRLYQGEYLGARLKDLGFTGDEDFTVTVSIPDVPNLRREVGQLGLFAGVKSDQNIRGGLVKSKTGHYTQFLVHNADGTDSELSRVGLLSAGDDLRLTLTRTAGKYALIVENQETQAVSTLKIRDASFLDGQKDLYVGLFAANVPHGEPRLITITEFTVTVWTRSGRPTERKAG